MYNALQMGFCQWISEGVLIITLALHLSVGREGRMGRGVQEVRLGIENEEGWSNKS